MTTLSIGDGANDVNMIIAAHVGVGIKGVEGQQAARASDFSFGEFRHLRRLLLFHGKESYRKNTTLILYNFFKNMILVLPQFWYGVASVYSAMTLYDSLVLQFFNLCYTSLPIIIYAAFDQEHKPEYAVKTPSLYRIGMERRLFNYKRFWAWIFSGALQAAPVCYFAYILSCSSSFNRVYSLEDNFTSTEGFHLGFYGTGLMVFTAAVVVSNLKIFLFSTQHSYLSASVIVLSILFYLLNVVIFSAIPGITLYQLSGP
jgi:phospholipid-transporting ATPase